MTDQIIVPRSNWRAKLNELIKMYDYLKDYAVIPKEKIDALIKEYGDMIDIEWLGFRAKILIDDMVIDLQSLLPNPKEDD